MISKFLVLVVGQHYLKPSYIYGDYDVLFKMLVDDSRGSGYLYLTYYHDDKLDEFVCLHSIYDGDFSREDSHRHYGIIVQR